MENKFPEFWYESNAYFGEIKSIEDLQIACNYKKESHDNCYTKDDFLDKSHVSRFNDRCYGTCSEHRNSKKTLRDFLEENLIDYSELK